jgi:two-component sensor histidine kinase
MQSVRFDWRRRAPLAWIVMGCSVLLTLLAWDVSRRSLSGRLRDQFMLRTEQLASAIVQRMEQHEAVLRGGVALFLASDEVNREEFRLYFEHLELERFYPGIQGIGFAELVRASELDATVDRVRREGFPEFTVHPAGVRPVYTPIVFIEPFRDLNMRAFGFDMYSETRRREAMQRAWRTGRSSMSGIVKLIQNVSHDDQPGFLLYLPVFRALASSANLEETYPIGFVYSPLRVNDLMHGILGHGPTDLDYTINEPGAAPFFTSRPASLTRDEPELTRDRSLEIAGRTWNVHFASRKNFGSWVSRSEPSSVLLAGTVINLLLFYILSTSASLRRRAEALAGEMTQELSLSHGREQEQMLRSLQEKETLLKEIHHRVKNNLQVVSSLLSLQRSYTHDEQALAPLIESQQRVLAMAALHEFLYQSKDLARVDTSAYLKHLVSMLSETYGVTSQVTIVLELSEVSLDVDHAIPCGLITNELVSNAFKYAYGAGRAGKLSVSLREQTGRIELSVADDGPGLPARRPEDAPTTLGLSLVELLAQQLGGELTMTSDRGARFVVSFPCAKRPSA